MNLPLPRPKKYADPLSVLQQEIVGITFAYHNGVITGDELVVQIGEALDKAQWAMRKAIFDAHPGVEAGSHPSSYDNEGIKLAYERGWNEALIEFESNLIKEISLELKQGRNGGM